MLIADIRNAITANCGRKNSEFTDQIDRWVNNTVKAKFTLTNDMWYLEDFSTIDTVIGQVTYNLPSFFKDTQDDGVLYRDGSGTSKPLDQISASDAAQEYSASDTGAPEAYVIDGDTYKLYPTPDAVYHIDWNITVFNADLSDSNTSNYLSVNFPDVYVNAGTYKGFQFLEEYERAAYWKNEMNESIDELVQYNVMRQLGKITMTASPNAKARYKNTRSDYTR